MLPIISQEFKSLIPPLTPEERWQLEQNILSCRRCHDAIILWNGIILDGHNRFEICVRHGVEFQIKEIPLESRDAAKLWILDNQLGRRNLTDASRIEIALLKAELLREKAQKNQSIGGRRGGSKGHKLLSKVSKSGVERIHVQKATADEAGVSEGTLYNYLQIKQHGNPALLAAVQSGQLKIYTAHRLLTDEIMKQLAVAGKMLKSIKSKIPPDCDLAQYPELQNKLAQLATTIRNLIIRLEERRHTHEATQDKPAV